MKAGSAEKPRVPLHEARLNPDGLRIPLDATVCVLWAGPDCAHLRGGTVHWI